MSNNLILNQSLTRRKPAQERARQKIELILEAAIRIIDEDSLEALTTNRIAERAGISIGTLYQYFSNKKEILTELGRRELKSVTAKMIATLSGAHPQSSDDQVRALIRVVFGAFGGRAKVHRVLLESALARGAHALPDEVPALIANLLSGPGVITPDGSHRRLSAAEAFVLTQAFTGVVRAAIGLRAKDLPRAQIEDALLRLVQGFLRG